MTALPIFAPADRGADLSPCGRYRFKLWRTWGPSKPLGFVMLNPSTADADLDDPTIRRCIGFAKQLGYGGVVVVNLFAWRATRPADLRSVLKQHALTGEGPDPTGGARNDEAIREVRRQCPTMIAAWGAEAGRWAPERVRYVQHELLHNSLECLALSKDGSPRHPLYLRGDAQPVVFGRAL